MGSNAFARTIGVSRGTPNLHKPIQKPNPQLKCMMAKVNGRIGRYRHPRFDAQTTEAKTLARAYKRPNTSAGSDVCGAITSEPNNAATSAGATSWRHLRLSG